MSVVLASTEQWDNVAALHIPMSVASVNIVPEEFCGRRDAAVHNLRKMRRLQERWNFSICYTVHFREREDRK